MTAIDDIRSRFNNALDRHGYGFHYSVLRRAEELNTSRLSPWVFEVCEFPVEVQGSGTRIDFILRPSQREPYLLIAECKRADPKFSHWCFVRAPLVRRRESELFIADRVKCSLSGRPGELADPLVGPRDICGDITQRAYHIGLAIKDVTSTGEASASEQDAIEKAASQVCRGVNGLIETMQKRTALFRSANPTPQGFYERTLLPVIFTTARLYVSEYNLSTADIHTGKCDISGAAFTETSWLYFQYHLSPGIKHTAKSEGECTTIGGLLDNEYVRTIPIVTAAGVDSFLSKFRPWE